MVLTQTELIARLEHEVRILLHLASKIEPAMLDFRPTSGQRSLLELLRYLAVFVPIHLRTIRAGVWDRGEWSESWRAEQAKAATQGFEELKAAIAQQPALFAEFVAPLSDEELRFECEMFGSKGTRGSWLVWLVLCHYVAYRMQLFLYLKSCGRMELGTLDLWAGMDSPPRA